MSAGSYAKSFRGPALLTSKGHLPRLQVVPASASNEEPLVGQSQSQRPAASQTSASLTSARGSRLSIGPSYATTQDLYVMRHGHRQDEADDRYRPSPAPYLRRLSVQLLMSSTSQVKTHWASGKCCNYCRCRWHVTAPRCWDPPLSELGRKQVRLAPSQLSAPTPAFEPCVYTPAPCCGPWSAFDANELRDVPAAVQPRASHTSYAADRHSCSSRTLTPLPGRRGRWRRASRGKASST
jgi:hypothetical protein